MAWHKTFPLAEVPEGEMVQYTGCSEPILVCQVSGTVYAVQDTCTHDTWSLCDGYLDGHIVECSLHMAKFDVRNGEVTALPACEALKVFPVKVEDGHVYVEYQEEEMMGRG
ncbi:3-phenylpropionate dioxygenase [Salipiger aestuarii]|nr:MULTISPECIES: non-heme iron oxygenase ferredoxin subunit [Rhodobacterales]EIE49955.1 phenylpropionate dioxygenase ferredoxin subunit [Citreicella sp. 357]KAA8605747.1 3-phenylpropionate dioxygenase [Salipiger aestuarii]KAA8612170.1 3-phenylpropionate dioxygenase [Salipiger aestuarii]KAB2539906.1 3-phenylpropionate dioxygenase [Salipiger aestuarii]